MAQENRRASALSLSPLFADAARRGPAIGLGVEEGRPDAWGRVLTRR
ncbi:MAG TPA: hypothetical protein VF615_15210 [Longimicrobiaceae bacterium]